MLLAIHVTHYEKAPPPAALRDALLSKYCISICVVSRYRRAQLLRQACSRELRLRPGAPGRHVSKQVSVMTATDCCSFIISVDFSINSRSCGLGASALLDMVAVIGGQIQVFCHSGFVYGRYAGSAACVDNSGLPVAAASKHEKYGKVVTS